MEEKDFLMQKIEFLEIELEELKHREKQQKIMYESMINSLSTESSPNLEPIHSSNLHENCEIRLFSIEKYYKETLLKLENDFFSAQQQNLNRERDGPVFTSR